MDFISTPFLTGLLSIIIIDLILAGDNAIVIGMAAKGLAKEQQRKAILWGTVGAIVIRALLTLAVVWLLAIPFLRVIGGALLLWIAYKLLTKEKEHETLTAGSSLRQAIQTIVMADVVMGLDNVLAIAGASHGSFILVLLGLLFSVPLVVWSSTWILKALERFPSLIYLGAAVLAYTAGKMISEEPIIQPTLEQNVLLTWFLLLAPIILIVGLGYSQRKQNQKKQSAA